MLILSAADVARAITDDDVLAAVEDCFRETSSGHALVPRRIKAVLDDQVANRILVMPAYLPRSHALATKVVTVFPGNAHRGMPLITGAVLLNDTNTGLPIALVDGTVITEMRTAAASSVATRALAVPSPRILAVIGAGAQGRAHLRFLCALYAFDEVRLCARRLDSARHLAGDAQSRIDAPVRAVATPEEAVSEADIVVTATTSRSPVLQGAWLAPGAHVCGIGAATPSHRELDSEVLERASVIAVDMREAALEEAGDLIVPIDEARLSPARVAEVGEILLGQRPGRGAAEDVTVYKGVGTAALDAAVAAAIHRRAVVLGIGTEVPFTAAELRG